MDLKTVKPETIKKSTVVLMAINNYHEKHGWWPSRREIVEITDLKSTSTVKSYLELLEELGFIELMSGAARAMNITPTGRHLIESRQTS